MVSFLQWGISGTTIIYLVTLGFLGIVSWGLTPESDRRLGVHWRTKFWRHASLKSERFCGRVSQEDRYERIYSALQLQKIRSHCFIFSRTNFMPAFEQTFTQGSTHHHQTQNCIIKTLITTLVVSPADDARSKVIA